MSLILEDTQVNEQSINQIIDAYKQKFQQESVLAVVDENLGVDFDVNPSPVSTGVALTPFNIRPLLEQAQQPWLAPTAVSLVSPFRFVN